VFYFILTFLALLINSVLALATSCDYKSILSSQLNRFLLISAFYQQQHSVSRAFYQLCWRYELPVSRTLSAYDNIISSQPHQGLRIIL
jgi:hypothetical protein